MKDRSRALRCFKINTEAVNNESKEMTEYQEAFLFHSSITLLTHLVESE
jgi:hypothetical protein